jgi:hypothetical protein
MNYAKTVAGIMAFVSLAIALGAAASKPERVWSCWHSATGTKQDAVAMGLIQEDGVVKIQGAEFIEYAILQDNDVGLVAVISYAEAGDTLKHLGADVLVIDAATLDFTKGNVFVQGAGADNRVRRGKCSLRQ